MIEIKYLKALKDNYIWLIQVDNKAKDSNSTNKVIVVDPSESGQVVDYIINNNVELHSILLTHGHPDHVGGVTDLVKLYNVPVYGQKTNDYATLHLEEGNEVQLLPDVVIKVIETFGHTMDGLSFLVNNKHLFCGDTLFAAGCGRVFTQDYSLMYESLLKIKSLSYGTLIYSGHEYTLNNLYFAINVEPDNSALINRTRQVEQIRLDDKITLPTNLELELETNPFLRCDHAVFNIPDNDNMTELEKFIQLRKMKDTF